MIEEMVGSVEEESILSVEEITRLLLELVTLNKRLLGIMHKMVDAVSDKNLITKVGLLLFNAPVRAIGESLFSYEEKRWYDACRINVTAKLGVDPQSLRSAIKQARQIYLRDSGVLDAVRAGLSKAVIVKGPLRAPERPTTISILSVGEGSFSGILSRLRKHRVQSLPPDRFIATELRSERELGWDYREVSRENIGQVRSVGVSVEFGVNAAELDIRYQGRRAKRIFFDFPYARKDTYYKGRKNGTVDITDNVVRDFFQSASKIQRAGDRVYVTVPHGSYSILDFMNRSTFVIGEGRYGLGQAAFAAGYMCIKKRNFISQSEFTGATKRKLFPKSRWIEDMVYFRYPDYEHVTTKRGAATPDCIKESYQYIFQKMPGQYLDPDDEQTDMTSLNFTWNCQTDSDSSEFSDAEFLPSAADVEDIPEAIESDNPGP